MANVIKNDHFFLEHCSQNRYIKKLEKKIPTLFLNCVKP